MNNKKRCIKYTLKRGNQCTVKCQTKPGNESIISNAKEVIYCPFCSNELLEMGYANNMEIRRNENMSRKDEIESVRLLCEKIGYGNLMDIASGLWAIKEGHPMHIPSVEGFMTEEGRKVAITGIEDRITELKKFGY